MSHTDIIYISTTEYTTVPILKYNDNIPNEIKVALYDDNGVITFAEDTQVFVSAKHTNNPLGFVKCHFLDESNQIIVVPLSNLASRGCYLECELLLSSYKNNTPSTLKSGKFYIVSNGVYEDVDVEKNKILVSDETKNLLNQINQDDGDGKTILEFMSNYREMMYIKEQRLVEVIKRAQNIQSKTLNSFNITSSSYSVKIPEYTAPLIAINKLGHISHSNNLCSTESQYVGKDVSELSDSPYSVSLDLGELSAGSYYVYVAGIESSGSDGFEYSVYWGSEGITDSIIPLRFDVPQRAKITLGIATPYYGDWQEERSTIYGKIEQLIVYRYGDKDTAYKPHISYEKPARICSYSSDNTLIDSIDIPSGILELDGYGLGMSQVSCNYIDFDRKVFVNDYEIVNDVIKSRKETVEIDVSEYLTNYDTIKNLKVQEGGYIKFFDTNGNAIYSTLEFTYLIKPR